MFKRLSLLLLTAGSLVVVCLFCFVFWGIVREAGREEDRNISTVQGSIRHYGEIIKLFESDCFVV